MAFTVPVENYVRSPYPSLPESKERYIQEELKKLERTLGTVSGALRDVDSLNGDIQAGAGFNPEVSLVSAATTDIGAAESLYVQITGTATITSFGTNFSGPRFLRFSGALVLIHNASLVLPAGINIATAAGDTCIVTPIAGGWVVSQYRRASTPVNGAVIDRAYAEYTANANLTAIIPFDDTVPQNTEGTQILSLSFAAKSPTNRLRIRFSGQASLSTNQNMAVAIFSSASANALVAQAEYSSLANVFTRLAAEVEYVPGTTAALTYSVRVGPATAVTMRMNGTSTARFFGGSSRAVLVIEEIAA